jgi:predicted transcriptional regulator
MALNHDGWDEIFSALKIVECVDARGYFDITADQIKKISGREPRLMAKIDFREHIPPVMHKQDMAILAIANGTYRIGRFDPFIDIEPVSTATPSNFAFPDNIITLNPQKLAHESAALDAALVSGVLHEVFGEDVALTIRGRSRSPDFVFPLNGINFPISGVQIEVDGGYEGATTVNLVEAKVGPRDNLSVRQLIYPQLAWERVIGKKKAVRIFICFYQEPILRFIPVIYEKGLCKADHSNELAFILEPIAKLNLGAIKATPNAPYPLLGVPFPQADNFDTVLAIFNIVVNEEEISKDSLLLEFDLTMRQITYYSDALKWMGLVEIKQAIISITPEGRDIASLSHAEKMKRLADIIFCEPIFNHVLHNRNSEVPASLFERWNIGGTTPDRRLKTVQSWVNYFEEFSKQEALRL